MNEREEIRYSMRLNESKLFVHSKKECAERKRERERKKNFRSFQATFPKFLKISNMKTLITNLKFAKTSKQFLIEGLIFKYFLH